MVSTPPLTLALLKSTCPSFGSNHLLKNFTDLWASNTKWGAVLHMLPVKPVTLTCISCSMVTGCRFLQSTILSIRLRGRMDRFVGWGLDPLMHHSTSWACQSTLATMSLTTGNKATCPLLLMMTQASLHLRQVPCPRLSLQLSMKARTLRMVIPLPFKPPYLSLSVPPRSYFMFCMSKGHRTMHLDLMHRP